MERRRRPRALTLILPDAEQPYLVLNDRKYTLTNFSEEGIGLWMPSQPPYGLNKGNHINGDVIIDNQIFAVQLEVVRHSNRTMGFRITHQSEELKTIFQKMLEPAAYATEIKAHPESGSRDKENGDRRLWYRGRGGTELLVWYDERQGAVHAVQLCWATKWVLKFANKKAETGLLREVERIRYGRLVQEEELLVHDLHPDPILMQQASQFFIAVPPPLPSHLLWQFLETGESFCLSSELIKNREVA